MELGKEREQRRKAAAFGYDDPRGVGDDAGDEARRQGFHNIT